MIFGQILEVSPHCAMVLLLYLLLLTYFQRISCPWCRFRSISTIGPDHSERKSARNSRLRSHNLFTHACLWPKMSQNVPLSAIESISLMVWRFRKTIRLLFCELHWTSTFWVKLPHGWKEVPWEPVVNHFLDHKTNKLIWETRFVLWNWNWSK